MDHQAAVLIGFVSIHSKAGLVLAAVLYHGKAVITDSTEEGRPTGLGCSQP